MNSEELRTALCEWVDKVVNTKLNMEEDKLMGFVIHIDYYDMINDVTEIIENGFDVTLK